MKLIASFATAVFVAAGTLGAQPRTAFLRVYGGGADHLADLTASGPAAYFMPGYNIGASAGIQLTRHLAVRGDFTFTRNPARGATPFAGADVNRFFYGALVELRQPVGSLTPFLFVGGGAVSIDQLGVDTFEPTTRPMVMYGGGVAYALPSARLGLFAEVKGLSYKWDMAGFDRTMVDVTYSGGLSYTLPFAF